MHCTPSLLPWDLPLARLLLARLLSADCLSQCRSQEELSLPHGEFFQLAQQLEEASHPADPGIELQEEAMPARDMANTKPALIYPGMCPLLASLKFVLGFAVLDMMF